MLMLIATNMALDPLDIRDIRFNRSTGQVVITMDSGNEWKVHNMTVRRFHFLVKRVNRAIKERMQP